jgi:hypothetical protein
MPATADRPVSRGARAAITRNRAARELAHAVQLSVPMHLAIALVVSVLGGCATDDSEVQCEVECPEPDLVMMHVEDMETATAVVSARTVSGSTVAPTFHLKLDFFGATGSLPGCPVVDTGLAMTLAGVPGVVEQAGGAYRGARWQCADVILAFTPNVHAASASIVVTDDTGTIVFNLGDALVERSVEGVDHPDWMYVGNEKSATFRWSPASDIATESTIYASWEDPTLSTGILANFAEPITHVDAATFTTKLPTRTSSTLWLTTAPYRPCGPNCAFSLISSVSHALTFPGQ